MADDIFEGLMADIGSGKTSLAPKLEEPEAAADPIFDSVMGDFQRQEERNKSLAILRSQGADPEAYAGRKVLSTTFEKPIDFVQRNQKQLEEFKGIQDKRLMFDNNPALAGFFVKDDNAEAISFDELRHLDGLSWFYRATADAWSSGGEDVDLANLRYRQLMGVATGEEIDRADAMSTARQPRTFGADSWMEQSWINAVKQLPIMGETLMGGLEGGLGGASAGAGAAALAGQLGPQVALPEEFITVPGAAVIGYNAGSTAGQFQASFRLESGLSYDEFKSLRDENGAVMDDDVARGAAMVAGSAAAILETIAFRKLASVIPGVDKLVGTVGRDAVRAALARPSARLALGNFARNLATTGATEVTTELAQEAITMFAGEVAKGIAGEEGAEFDMLSAGDAAERLGDTFVQTMQAMTIMAPALSSTRLGHDVTRARQATRDVKIIEALSKHAAENALNVRLPEKAKEAIQSLTENGPVENVYVAPEAFSTYFQSAEEASQFAASVGLTDEYNESQRVGRDMEIPLPTYYVNIAGTEIGTAIQQFVKFSPDRMTSAEAESFNVEWAEVQQRLRSEYEAEAAGETVAAEGVEAIFEDVKTQAMNAGFTPDQASEYARLISNTMRVFAESSGQDPQALYGSYGLEIKRALPQEARRAVDSLDLALEVIRAGKVDPLRKEVEKASGPSLLQAIIARGGIVDTGGELAGMDLPRGTVRAGAVEAPRLEGIDDTAAASSMGDFNQFSADDTMRAMWEDGYFPEFEERPTTDDLFNAIREETSGVKRFSASQTRTDDPRVQQADGLVKFADMLDQAGLDPKSMTNDEIRAAIDEIVNADPDAGALYQETVRPQTETDAFKAWFGDSKVVDENGEPLVVYHGTGSDIEAFDHSVAQDKEGRSRHLGMGAGKFYLTTEKAVAQRWADAAPWRGGGAAPNIVEAYVRIENPISEQDYASRYESMFGEAITDTSRSTVQRDLNIEKLDAALKDEGVDGIMDTSSGGLGQIAVFDPTQIKSVSNRGTFDANDPRILYQTVAPDLSPGGGSKTIKIGDTTIDYGISRDGETAEIILVKTPKAKRGEGSARTAMKQLLETFDAAGLTVFLTAEPMDKGVTSGRLKGFYKSLGFRENAGKKKDFRSQASMVRDPVEREYDQTTGQIEGAKRGSIQLAPGRTIINLFDQADQSTFFHEAGHFFLEVFRDIATQTHATAFTPNPKGLENRINKGGAGDYSVEMGPLRDRVLSEGVDKADPSDVALYEVLTALVSRNANGNDLDLLAKATAAGRADLAEAIINLSVSSGLFEMRILDERIADAEYKAENPTGHARAVEIQRGLVDQAQAVTVALVGEYNASLGSSPGTIGPQSKLVEDWRKIQKYLGVGDDGVISTEAHEKWARTWEAYLFEGKAPSQEVASMMARFSSWLSFVYKSVKALRVPINDEIRGVMDRMLATEQEIAAARKGPEFRPALDEELLAGMSAKQRAAYVETAGRAVDEAKREMNTRMVGDIVRETTAEWRAEKKAIREVVKKQMDDRPVYKVLTYLRTGVMDDAPAERLYLDRDAILGMFGPGALIKLPKGVPPIYRAKGGVHPDYLAELFGFASGHDMMTQLMSVPNKGRAIAEEVDLRMKQKYGDLMGDAVARFRVANEAIANDATGELLAAELGVLVKKGLVTSSVSVKQAKQAARSMVRSKSIREAIRTKLYMNANARAAAEAERAILKKDWKAAVEAKKRQLLNHYMAMESREAEKDVEAAVKYLNKFAGRKKVQGVWQTHLDQIETLLTRFDLRKSVTLKDEQRRTSLASWLEEQEQLGEIVDVTEMLRGDGTAEGRARADAFRKPYRQMTPDDLMAVRDAVRNIEHLGRRWAKVYGDIEAREHREKVQELVVAAGKSGPNARKQKGQNPDTLDKIIGATRSADGALLKIEQFINFLDGGDINGPFNRMIWRPIAAAEARANDLQVEYSAKIQAVLGKLDKARMSEKITIPGLDRTMLRADIVAVALNTGSESNLDKMMRGEGWDRQPGILRAVLSHLNADEARAVQEVWDTINELWPEIEALQKRMTGNAPPKIAAQATEIAGVQLRGGYFPMVYDAQRDHRTELRNAAQADKMFENTYLRPETPHGFAKERKQAYAAPVDFNLDNVGRHIISVIHDTTHREAVLSVNKLLTDENVRAAIVEKYGRERYNKLVPWLQSIANDRRKDDGNEMINNLLRGVRSRASIMGMGIRYTTMVTQSLGYSASMELVSPRHLAGAMRDFFGGDGGAAIGAGMVAGFAGGGFAGALAGGAIGGGLYAYGRSKLGGKSSMDQMSEEVYALSGEMRHRKNQMDRDIRDNIRRITGQNTWIADAQRFGFAGIGYMDQAVTVPTWMAAYRQHLAGLPTDQEGAIAAGDRAIRLSQGSGGAKDLAAIMRGGEGLRLMTMFYSYFSAYYARQRNWGKDMKRKWQTGEGSYSQLLARQVFLSIIPAVMADLIVGRGPDDEEGYAKWAAKKIAMYPFMALPVIGPAVNAAGSPFSYTISPAGRTLDEGIVQPLKMVGKALDGDVELRAAIKQTIETTGYAVGLPLGQIATSVDNVWKAIEQDDFQLRDLVLTRPKK